MLLFVSSSHPDVRELFLKQGATSYATSPEEFAKVVQRDIAK
jgi:tripartite-type tricarboxylate transporter receptor subunit TctC